MASQPRIYHLVYFVLMFVSSIHATELLPWFSDQLLYEGRVEALYQYYPYLNSKGEHIRKKSNDLFFTLSVLNSPFPEVCLEIESTFAHTPHKSNGLDNIRLTGRWLVMDDVAGDPISVVFGLTATNAYTGSLKDISSFHHGRAEAEFHAAIGKEYASRTCYLSRWWVLGAIGIAEMGSPWGRANFTYEFRMKDKHEIRSFIHNLWGWGNRRLHDQHFHGYGSVAHRSVDLGLRYTYLIPYFGNANIEYSYRVFAYNFPANCQRIHLQLLYQF